jgi:hypothetical protein
METEVGILIQVRAAAQQKVLFLPHALRQMLRPDRMIRRAEVRRVIIEGDVLEDYPKDP